VAELVDASDLKSEGLGRPGSIPGIPTSLGWWTGRVGGAATCLALGPLLGTGGCVSPGAGGGEPPASSSGADSTAELLEVDEAELRDRIRGAWLGQMIGVTWGFPTEFYARYIWELFPDLHQRDGEPANLYAAFEGQPIPLDLLPAWTPDLINGAYTQDDLYVEVPFMEALAGHGVNAGWGPLGEAFAASEFPLYHANLAARDNLRRGLTPPASGHWSNTGESDDIDWQIESDFVGLMAPAQPAAAVDLAFRMGHVMNHGDGVYGGVFVATMLSTAFTAGSVLEIAEAGRDVLPPGSGYRQVVDDVFDMWEGGEPFDVNLDALYKRYGALDRCAEWAGAADPLNIDARLNGAFILLGLLYGEGDLARSMRLAMAAGQDSDCNPSNVGSILGAFMGAEALAQDDDRWLSALDESRTFETTPYRLDELVELNLELARGVVELRGGEAPHGGRWSIPVGDALPSLLLEQWPLTPNAAPTLQVTVERVGGRAVRVSARAEDSDGRLSYQWCFGDLAFARGPDHVHRYRAPGTYELIALASDRTGNTTIVATSIQVP
jgi:hypothetical protein